MIHRTARVAALLALMLLIAQSPMAAVPAAVAPAVFVAESLTDSATSAPVAVAVPTALAFTPDGRLLVTQQTGQLRVYQNGALLAAPALDLTVGDKICPYFERGLLGVAVDPDFAANHYIYVYYTFK